jgi:hypothetical protein
MVMVVDERPAQAIVDPYVTRVDRDPFNNEKGID